MWVLDRVAGGLTSVSSMHIILCMIKYAKQVKVLRKQMGLSQVELSQLAGISLPSLQNIEAEHANPSIKTLSAVLDILGQRLTVEASCADWDALSCCGAPITKHKSAANIRPIAEILIRELRKAAVELSLTEGESRKKDAFIALAQALVDGYPSLARSWHLSAPIFSLPKSLSPRQIKLRRIALQALSEYL